MNNGIPTLVIDSNVLISLLVFEDPRYLRVARAWRGKKLRVATNTACAAEFRRVLAYPQLKLDQARQIAIYARFEEMVSGSSESTGTAAAAAAAKPDLPVCADADDQKFLELAQACAADFLVTGDRELLKLARRVSFAIVTVDELERRLADQTPT